MIITITHEVKPMFPVFVNRMLERGFMYENGRSLWKKARRGVEGVQ